MVDENGKLVIREKESMQETVVKHKYEEGDDIWVITDGDRVFQTEITNVFCMNLSKKEISYHILYTHPDLKYSMNVMRAESDLYDSEEAALTALKSEDKS